MRPLFKVQTPRLGDYPELLRVWEASVRATHDFLPSDYIDLLYGLMRDHYLDAVMLICCKDAQQRIGGFAGIAAGRVEMLFVAPEFRGQGVGKLLLRCAIDELNADELDVNEQNAQAVGFYFKQGFEVIGRSETDGMGRPFPLLHLRLAQRPEVRNAS